MKVDFIVKKKKVTERRMSERLKIPVQVQYRIFKKRKVIHEAFSEDISGGGVRLKLKTPIKQGQKLKTFIYFPEEQKPVAAFSKVIWCRRSHAKKDIYDIGLKHIKIEHKDRERFIFLFCEMMMNYFILGRPKISI